MAPAQICSGALRLHGSSAGVLSLGLRVATAASTGTGTHPPLLGSLLSNACSHARSISELVIGTPPVLCSSCSGFRANTVSKKQRIQQSVEEFVGCGHLLKHASPFFCTSLWTFSFAQVAFTVLSSFATRHAQDGAAGSAQLPSRVVEYQIPPNCEISLFQ